MRAAHRMNRLVRSSSGLVRQRAQSLPDQMGTEGCPRWRSEHRLRGLTIRFHPMLRHCPVWMMECLIQPEQSWLVSARGRAFPRVRANPEKVRRTRGHWSTRSGRLMKLLVCWTMSRQREQASEPGCLPESCTSRMWLPSTSAVLVDARSPMRMQAQTATKAQWLEKTFSWRRDLLGRRVV